MAFTKPIFPFVRYARPSGLTLIPPSKDHARTASRLIQLFEIPGVFGEPMSKAIYDLTELIWYAEWIKGDPKSSQSFDDETEDYFNTEVLYVEYALHTDRYTPTGETKGEQRSRVASGWRACCSTTPPYGNSTRRWVRCFRSRLSDSESHLKRRSRPGTSTCVGNY